MKKNNDNLVFASVKKSSSSDFGIDEKEISISDQQKILITVIYADIKRKYCDMSSAKDQVDYESISDEYLKKFSQQTGPENIDYLLANQFKILENIEIQKNINLAFNDFFTEKKEKLELNQKLKEIISQPKKIKMEKARKEIQTIKQKKVDEKSDEKITKPISDKSNDVLDIEVQQTSGFFSRITRRITGLFSTKPAITRKINEKQLTEEISIDKTSQLNNEEVDENKPKEEIEKEEPCLKCLEFSLCDNVFCGVCGRKTANMDYSKLSKFDEIVGYGNALIRMKDTQSQKLTYGFLDRSFSYLAKEYRKELADKNSRDAIENPEKYLDELGYIFKIQNELIKNDYFKKNPEIKSSEIILDMNILSDEKYYNLKSLKYINTKVSSFLSILENFLCEENGIDTVQAKAQIYLFQQHCSQKALEFFCQNIANPELQKRFLLMDFVELNIKNKAYEIIKTELKVDEYFDDEIKKMNLSDNQEKTFDKIINNYFRDLCDHGADQKIILSELSKKFKEEYTAISLKMIDDKDDKLEDILVEESNKSDNFDEDKYFFDVFSDEEMENIRKFQYLKHIQTKILQLKSGEMDTKFDIDHQKMILLDENENPEKTQFIREEIIDKLNKVNKNCLKKQDTGSSEYIHRNNLHTKFIDNIYVFFQLVLAENFQAEKEWIIKKNKEIVKFDYFLDKNNEISQEVINRLSEDALDYLFIKSRNFLQFNKNNVDELLFDNEMAAWLEKRKDELITLEKENRANRTFINFLESLPINKREEFEKFYKENEVIKYLSAEEKQKWLDRLLKYSNNNYVSQQKEILENDLPKS